MQIQSSVFSDTHQSPLIHQFLPSSLHHHNKTYSVATEGNQQQMQKMPIADEQSSLSLNRTRRCQTIGATTSTTMPLLSSFTSSDGLVQHHSELFTLFENGDMDLSDLKRTHPADNNPQKKSIFEQQHQEDEGLEMLQHHTPQLLHNQPPPADPSAHSLATPYARAHLSPLPRPPTTRKTSCPSPFPPSTTTQPQHFSQLQQYEPSSASASPAAHSINCNAHRRHNPLATDAVCEAVVKPSPPPAAANNVAIVSPFIHRHQQQTPGDEEEMSSPESLQKSKSSRSYSTPLIFAAVSKPLLQSRRTTFGPPSQRNDENPFRKDSNKLLASSYYQQHTMGQSSSSSFVSSSSSSSSSKKNSTSPSSSISKSFIKKPLFQQSSNSDHLWCPPGSSLVSTWVNAIMCGLGISLLLIFVVGLLSFTSSSGSSSNSSSRNNDSRSKTASASASQRSNGGTDPIPGLTGAIGSSVQQQQQLPKYRCVEKCYGRSRGAASGHRRSSSSQQSSSSSSCDFCRKNGITFLNLYGSPLEMGIQYGSVLKYELWDTLKILEKSFSIYGGKKELVRRAEFFTERYSSKYKMFLIGISIASSLSYNDVKILNAMETIPGAGGELTSACMFAYIPEKFTETGGPLIARNYDFPKPFDRISKNLVVAYLHEPGKQSTAIIGMPGQIYCPTCVNQHGLFLELNNGMPSGSPKLRQNHKSMLINMMEFMQNSKTFDQLSRSLSGIQSDYSLIINSGGKSNVQSFEYSTRDDTHKTMNPDPSAEIFVSTNFFLNQTWGPDVPTPMDIPTWLGVTRRSNMLQLLRQRSSAEKKRKDRLEKQQEQGYRQQQKHSVDSLKADMDVGYLSGGAKWFKTIYQILFDPVHLKLSVRTIANGRWTDFDLNLKAD